MNTVIICGNLGSDPIKRATASGMSVCNLSVATNEGKTVNGEWQPHTEWHNVSVFGKTADACANNLAKGSKVTIRGKLRTRKFTDKDGNDRKATEIVADEIDFVARPTAQTQSAPRQSAPPQPTYNGDGAYGADDIPF